MVALAVRFLGQKPVTCNARPLLHRAYSAFCDRRWIEAGYLLREAVRLYLVADCEWHGVTVSKRKVRQTPRALLDALNKDGHCDDYCFDRIGVAIDIGNKTAHLQFVAPTEIEDAIHSMHFILDNSTYLNEQPAAGRIA